MRGAALRQVLLGLRQPIFGFGDRRGDAVGQALAMVDRLDRRLPTGPSRQLDREHRAGSALPSPSIRNRAGRRDRRLRRIFL